MPGFDYDVIVIGSGFGGSVAALRATEKGYKVGVMEAGKRLPDSAIPGTNWDMRKTMWQPQLGAYGLQRIEFLDDVLILCGAGVGGGSHVYANTLYVPPKKFFGAAEWSGITDWEEELAPFYDQAQRMLGVVRVPYLESDADRLLRDVARDMGQGETYNRAPVGVYFGTPGVEADDPYFAGEGPRRKGCINCGNCMIGCGHNAKNKLTVNYLYLAEKRGAVVHELHEVYELKPLPDGGYEVHTRHPGWFHLPTHENKSNRFTAEQVVVAAHAYGSSKLLHHMQHDGMLPHLSDQLGKLARTNSEVLLSVQRPYGSWKKDPDQCQITPGSVSITSAVWPDPDTSIEPVVYGVGSNFATMFFTYHTSGTEPSRLKAWMKELVEHPLSTLGIDDPRHWAERSFCLLVMQTKDDSLELYWKDGRLHSRPTEGHAPPPYIPVANEFAKRLSAKMGAEVGGMWTEVVNKTASAHFIGGMSIAEGPARGVVDPYQRAFGHPGLYVTDGSVMPANPGVNPSLTITALAERTMSFWPNKGEADTRPPLGSGYKRIKSVRPNQPAVPESAPGALSGYQSESSPEMRRRS